MGSNPGARGSYEAAIEIYTPPYLFDANDRLITTNRPSITAISPASGVSATTRPFGDLHQHIGDRLGGAGTPGLFYPCLRHGPTADRLVRPRTAAALQWSRTHLNLTTPPNGNIAPPGYYMVFLLDSAGVPSMADSSSSLAYSTAPPSGSIISPASDVTITAGGAVTFGTSSSAAKYSWVFPGGAPATSTAQNPGTVTFASSGTYQASLTVVDSSGNSDPNPPTRKITVTPHHPRLLDSGRPVRTAGGPRRSRLVHGHRYPRSVVFTGSGQA